MAKTPKKHTQNTHSYDSWIVKKLKCIHQCDCQALTIG